MKNRGLYSEVDKLEQEINRKENIAKDAKTKGMFSTYSNYMEDLSILKVKLKKMRTNPGVVY